MKRVFLFNEKKNKLESGYPKKINQGWFVCM